MAPSPDDPSTPQDVGPPPPPSPQVALPSTEVVPASPMDGNESFKTEANDDRPAATVVIASSLTPPPSTQLASHGEAMPRPFASSSQQSALCSPPATILKPLRDRET
ncbi:hypothetical protein E4U41_001162, partial [Claviceps citrina]